MKYLIYTLVLSVSFLPTWTPVASANTTGSGTGTGTGTGTSTGSGTSTSTAATKCTENRTQTYGYKDENCYSYNTSSNQDQKNSQNDTKKTNDKGGSQMSTVGMIAIAGGAAMVAAGMATTPTPNMGLIAAGVALMGLGAMSLMGAKKAKQNSDVAGANEYKMSDITNDTNDNKDKDKTNPKTGGDNPGTNHTPLVSTTLPEDSTGRSKAIFDEFNQQTGIDASQLISDINAGKSVAEALGDKGKMKMSADQLQSAMDKSMAEGGAGAGMSSDDMMSKLGLSQADLDALAAANAKGTTGMGDDANAYAANGSGASRAPASTAAANSSLDALFGGKKDDAVVPGGSGANGDNSLSPEVQAALDRAGISGLSIFQMVHSQYRRKTPMMFGVERVKSTTPTDAANPFSNLGADNKVEF